MSNFLSAKHQTLLKIAYLFRRLAFGHCTVGYLEEHCLSKKASGFFPLRKYQKFFIKKVLKSCLHCNHVLFTLSLSNFLPSKYQTLLKILYLFTRLAFRHCTLKYFEKHCLGSRAFILEENNTIILSDDCQRDDKILL